MRRMTKEQTMQVRLGLMQHEKSNLETGWTCCLLVHASEALTGIMSDLERRNTDVSPSGHDVLVQLLLFHLQ